MLFRLLCGCGSVALGVVALNRASTFEPRADFSYLNPSDIHSLDPARMSWTQDFRVAINLWEGLTNWDPATADVTEGVAFLPPVISEGGLTYTFSLRTDSRWSSGDPVTAEDFLRGWRRAIEPGSAADYAFLIMDNFAGAKEYIAWRASSVSLLTGLSRLAQKREISPEQAVAVCRFMAQKLGPESSNNAASSNTLPGAPLAEIVPPSQGDWSDPSATPNQAQLAIQSAPADWKFVHLLELRRHAQEMDDRFRGVGMRANGPHEISIRLSSSCPYLLDILSLPLFMPVHQSIEIMREGFLDVPLTPTGLVVTDVRWTKPHCAGEKYSGLTTNGPYRLYDWQFKRRARMVVNEHHRLAPRIQARTIDMIVMDHAPTALMAFESGSLHFLPDIGVPFDYELVRLANSGERKDFVVCPALATYFLVLNCSTDVVDGRSNPMRDVRVRRAISLALNRTAIANKVRARGEPAAESFVPPGLLPGYVPPKTPSFDPGEARRLLASAAADGVVVDRFSLWHTKSDERTFQAIAHDLKVELGLEAELRVKESKAFSEDLQNHRFMIARGKWYADYSDPTSFLDCLRTGNGNNDSGYSNPDFDRLMDEAASTSDLFQRFELLARAEAIVVQRDFPVIPIVHLTEPMAISSKVSGITPNHRLWFPFHTVELRP